MQHIQISLGYLMRHAKIWACLTIFFFPFLVQEVSAQCPLTCNDNVQASLNEYCENEITWDALLEGNPPLACIPDLSVEIKYQNGNTIQTSPIVTVDEINKLLIGTVTHVPTGTSCQTLILVEDKLKPVLSCLDTLLSTFHDTAPEVIGFPDVTDNCTHEVDLIYFDQNNTFNCTLTDTVSIINRSWTAIDTSGNTATCLQKIYVYRPHLDSIQFPANLDNITAPPLYCNSFDIDPEHTGVPMFDSLLIDSISSFYIEYEDFTAHICDGSFSVFRDWTVYDGCAASKRLEEQTINIMDTLPPNLECPADMTVSVESNNCQATVTLPDVLTSDSCSSEITITLEGSFGLIAGTTIPNLDRGIYETICQVADGCGNVSSCEFNISVVDDIPPVAVGISGTTLSLLPQGTTYLPATTFDGGSWDNCGSVTFEVQRMETPHCPGSDATAFGGEVPFYCCDAGKMVEIQLRVTDENGNSSKVTTQVLVVDNLEPTISCPSSLTLDCSENYNNLSLTGEATAGDNCSGFTVESTDVINLDACGEGTVMRTWTVMDVAGQNATCAQTIHIENLTPYFINENNITDPTDGVEWPGNYISDTCGDGLLPDELPIGFDYPKIISDGYCQMVALSYSDIWLSQPNNACIEILRNWTIIDWCQFNQTTFEGSWQYGQVIRIQNSDPPIITSSCELKEFCSDGSDCQTGTVSMQIDATDDCNEVSELKFAFTIDFFDDGTTNISGSGKAFSADIPIGIHRVYWEVEDGCHNMAQCNYLFVVSDCKKPTPVCEDLVIEIMDTPTPMVSISPIDLDAGSNDNCTEANALQFSFSTDITDVLKTFGCDDLGINQVELWVTDEEGNQDFCVVEVEVQANNNACLSPSVVSGNVATDNGDDVSLVNVFLNNITLSDSILTSLDGLYQFDNVPLGEDYTITPFKNTSPLNGVTTFDVVLITKHILGVEILDSPYKIIAADANHSGTITTLDIVHIRKLVLNISTSFPNNNSWRFIAKDYQFDNPTMPLEEDFPELVSINNLSDNIIADFIAIKVGDVNASVDVTE